MITRARLRAAVARVRGFRQRREIKDITESGERVTHLFPNDCYVAHLSLYRFVVPFVGGAAVLDAGCGAGYGAAYLADHGAGMVTGIDASQKAIAFCQRHFQRPNLRYAVMDVERLEGLAPAAYGAVVCSNVLEHVPDVPAFLRGAWRLVDPSGVLVIAVPPIVSEALREQNLANPYHLNIWSPRQWVHTLELYFSDVRVFQHWYDRPGVELNLANTPRETVVREDDFVFTAVGVDELYSAPTITAVFAARSPKAEASIPASGARPRFIDDSFTRPAAALTSSPPVAVHEIPESSY